MDSWWCWFVTFLGEKNCLCFASAFFITAFYSFPVVVYTADVYPVWFISQVGYYFFFFLFIYLQFFFFRLSARLVLSFSISGRALRFAGGKLHKNPVTARWPTNNPHNTGLLATDDRSIGRGPTSREPHQPLNRRFEPLHSDI